MDLVSIVIPVYNMGSKIINCTKSVLSQTYQNLEVILVDDGSTDDSLVQCEKLKKIDDRVRVFHTENRGSGPARNEGIRNARGRYIYFPDADDFLEPNAIEVLVNKMNDNDCDLVVFGYKNVGTNGNLISTKKYSSCVFKASVIRENYSEYLALSGKYTIQGAPWNKFFDLNVIKENNVEYPALRRHQDEGFIARYVDVAKKVCFITDILYTYYVNDLSRQWDKYPVNYINAVEGLFEERKRNILLWNKEDNMTHELVYQEYICGIIKALELSFSPKFNFSYKQRKKWIIDSINKSELLNVKVPQKLGKYQKFIMKQIKGKHHNLLYFSLHFKIIVEKNGLLHYFKR